MTKWTHNERLCLWFSLIAFLLGLIIGASVGRNHLANAVCEDKGFTDYEIQPGSYVRCFTVLTLEE